MGRATALVLEQIDGLAWWSDREVVIENLRRAAPALADPARRIDRSQTGRVWWSDLDRARQVVLGPVGTRPEPHALVPDERTLAWLPWRLPRTLTTSGHLSSDLVSPALLASEYVDSFPDPLGLWAVEVDPGALVFEVHGSDDWVSLCERFPRVIETPDDYRLWGMTGPRALVPDWPAVAREFDGVHISMGGLLTATGVVREAGGAQCVLDDVDCELTAWLRPAIRVGERLGVAAHHDVQPRLA